MVAAKQHAKPFTDRIQKKTASDVVLDAPSVAGQLRAVDHSGAAVHHHREYRLGALPICLT